MRFSLLHHDHPFPHWDLLLQIGDLCRTWRLMDDPSQPGPWRAEAIADHRLYYLDYEGPVSDNRGQVVRIDGGEIVWITATESQATVLCFGTKWRGRLTLHHQTECQWQAELNAKVSALH